MLVQGMQAPEQDQQNQHVPVQASFRAKRTIPKLGSHFGHLTEAVPFLTALTKSWTQALDIVRAEMLNLRAGDFSFLGKDRGGEELSPIYCISPMKMHLVQIIPFKELSRVCAP